MYTSIHDYVDKYVSSPVEYRTTIIEELYMFIKEKKYEFYQSLESICNDEIVFELLKRYADKETFTLIKAIDIAQRRADINIGEEYTCKIQGIDAITISKPYENTIMAKTHNNPSIIVKVTDMGSHRSARLSVSYKNN